MLYPVGKIGKKAVCRSVFFDNMALYLALYFECRINKNALFQFFQFFFFFLAILFIG